MEVIDPSTLAPGAHLPRAQVPGSAGVFANLHQSFLTALCTSNSKGVFMAELLYKDEVYAIIGAAMEVHNHLGSGFLEPIYQEAMEIETLVRKIPYKPQQDIRVLYKGKQLKKTLYNRPDMLRKNYRGD
jgi:hypothetical protein